MFAAKIDVSFVSSTTVMTETRELSFSNATKSLVIGGSARRKAEVRERARALAFTESQSAGRIELTGGHGFERAAIDLAFIGGIVQAQADERGNERRQLDDDCQAEVEDEQLQQQRRPPNQLHPARQQRANRRRSIHSAARDQHPDGDRERHRQTREHEGDHRRATKGR